MLTLLCLKKEYDHASDSGLVTGEAGGGGNQSPSDIF